MTTVEALNLALKREETSIELYQGMIKDHKDLTELLTMLLNEEFKHKKLIGEEIYKLTRY